MDACKYVWTHVRMYGRTYVCVNACKYVWTHVNIYVYIGGTSKF